MHPNESIHLCDQKLRSKNQGQKIEMAKRKEQKRWRSDSAHLRKYGCWLPNPVFLVTIPAGAGEKGRWFPSLWRGDDGLGGGPVRWCIHSLNQVVVQEPPAMTNYSQSHPYQLDSIPSHPTPWSFILSVRKFYLSVNPICPVSVRFLVPSYHMYLNNIWFVIQPQLLKKKKE